MRLSIHAIREWGGIEAAAKKGSASYRAVREGVSDVEMGLCLDGVAVTAEVVMPVQAVDKK